MANPGGANSPTSYQPTQTVPYGQKKQDAQLQAAAPVAGQKASSLILGTPQRATEVALAQAQPAVQTAPAPQPAAPDPVAQTWAELAATPGASDLVRMYAARAQQ